MAVTYRYDYVGTHVLPLLLQCVGGKALTLFLKAQTIQALIPRLVVRHSSLELSPVPISIASSGRPCSQVIELSNVGSGHANWRLSTDSLEDLNSHASNSGVKVLTVTPLSGILAPSASTYLHVQFTPVEVKKYVCPLRLQLLVDGGASVIENLMFDVACEGYDPRVEGLRPGSGPYPLSLPSQTYAPIPRTGLALSTEVVALGQVKPGTSASRLSILVNFTSEHVLTYHWDTRGLFDPKTEAAFSIRPESGHLAPGSNQLVTFELETPLRGCSFDIHGEVVCHISWTHVDEFGAQRSSYMEHVNYEEEEVIAVDGGSFGLKFQQHFQNTNITPVSTLEILSDLHTSPWPID